MRRVLWLPLLAVALVLAVAAGASAQSATPLYLGQGTPQTAAPVPGGLGAEPPPFTMNPATGPPPYSPFVRPIPPNTQIAQEAGFGLTAPAGIPAPIAGASAISITDDAVYVISGGMMLKYDKNLCLVEQIPLPASASTSEAGLAAIPPAVGRGRAWISLLTGLNAQGYTFGKGTAYVWLDPEGKALHYLVNLTNVDNITGVYIHYRLGNLPDVQAPAVAPLYVGPIITAPFTGTLAQGTITSDNLINLMAERPLGNLLLAIIQGRAFVTVHTTQRPQGELMGKLVPLVTGA
jgi:hypothetical protein